jgi:hypothetical protein
MPLFVLTRADQNNEHLSPIETQAQPLVPPSRQHYNLSDLIVPLREELNPDYNTSKWTAPTVGELYLGQHTESSVASLGQVENMSPTNQDMVDYLAEMIPDIWIADPMPSLSSISDTVLLHNYNRHIPPPTEGFGSSNLTDDYSTDRLPFSANDVRSVRQARTGAEAQQDHYRLDLPACVVDDLYVWP